jgi:hypothetical protein
MLQLKGTGDAACLGSMRQGDSTHRERGAGGAHAGVLDAHHRGARQRWRLALACWHSSAAGVKRLADVVLKLAGWHGRQGGRVCRDTAEAGLSEDSTTAQHSYKQFRTRTAPASTMSATGQLRG